MCDNNTTAIISPEQMMELAASNRATAQELSGMVQQMGVYLIQLDARLRRQEELLSKKITLSSAQHKRLCLAIRRRAVELQSKYHLGDELRACLRGAIKTEIKERWGVRDLHDLPESLLGEAVTAAETWDSYSFVRRLRAEKGGDEL